MNLGLGLKTMGSFFEGVSGPGSGGLLDSEMSSLVSIAAALRRSTETVSSHPLRSILKVLSVESNSKPNHKCSRQSLLTAQSVRFNFNRHVPQ